ncbi:MAG: ThuA domain-containing protein [Trueperaceae bacterium]|nr:ThuA domain-containing protein [Trueperaceae bacterium]MCC6310743.1 ThuA domain-containing protein [Trueperaceae bacterium]MCO5174125.1 ThuA domain-containing protein [Trueperaceae bacterium]MCW5820028.1 ThuA domain-containing protein [Trueperaceae bacterium]
MRVTVFNEFLHERESDVVREIYPDGIHAAVGAAVKRAHPTATVGYATLHEPEHGLTQAVVDATDVLFWWGHKAHDLVDDAVVDRVQDAVLAGMGLVVLHSGHYSKPFRRLLGTTASLKWREADEKERLWCLQPGHPLLEGVPDYFELPREEMYGERFDVPDPDELLMISWFQGGEVFRSLATWRRGHGTVVYFRPGHETYPTYHDANVQRVLANAAAYAAARVRRPDRGSPETPAIEQVPNPGKEHILGLTSGMAGE